MPLPIKNKRPLFFYIGKVERIETFQEPDDAALELAKDRGIAVYYTPNEMGDVKNEKGNFRHKKNVVKFNCSFADFDDGTKEMQRNTISSCGLKPSVIVETGRGYHTYWNISDESVTLDRWEALQKRIAHFFKSDPAVSDAARLMRYPGSWHIKEGYEPSIVKTVFTSEAVYSIGHIESFFPAIHEKKYAPSEDRGRIRQAYIPPPASLVENQRHAALKHETARGYAITEKSAWPELREQIAAWYIRSCVVLKPHWQKEVNDMCDYYEQLES